MAYDLPSAPVMFELDLDAVLRRPLPVFKAIGRHHPVERDLAIVVKESVSHASVIAAIREATGARSLLREALCFDVYRPQAGANSSTSALAADEKSLAVRLTLNRDDATLTEAEIEAAVQSVLDALTKQLGARLR